MKKLLISIIIFIFGCIAVTSCIEDSFTNSPSDQPVFSVDTLKMGVVFTEELTTTHRFTVTNPSTKSIAISSIGLSGTDAQYFRLNVDGFSGRQFNNVEIRGRDSIYVFVEATFPHAGADLPVEMEAHIDFGTNGVSRSVVVNAQGQDVIRLRAERISSNTIFDSPKPYQIFDSLVIDKDATLTLAPGTKLLFHDKASLVVYGRLISNGTTDHNVILSGDRTGNVVSDISFDLMSRQWQGVEFRSGSKGNILSNTIIKNTIAGVIVDGYDSSSDLTLINSRLRNSGQCSLIALHADIDAVGCEFAEAAEGLVYLHGGNHKFNHCTFANYYLFAVISGPAISFGHFNQSNVDDSGLPLLKADISNCIIYGLGKDLSHGDLTDSEITINRCLLKSDGTDDNNFIDCIWNQDPLYYTVRNEYLFDYRLREDSPAIGAAYSSLTDPRAQTDGYGLSRGDAPDLGAYVFKPESSD